VKKIRNVSDELVVINKMTLPKGHEMPVLDPQLLGSSEVRQLLNSGSIVIVDDDSA
jgi:hypothetical protein